MAIDITKNNKKEADMNVLHNSKADTWVRRDNNTGQFMVIKSNGEPFKDDRRAKALDVIAKLKDK